MTDGTDSFYKVKLQDSSLNRRNQSSLDNIFFYLSFVIIRYNLCVQACTAGVEAESIPDVLRLRGGGNDDSSSDEEATMGMGESQTDDDESGIVTHSWV